MDIDIQSLTKSYSGEVILDNIDFSAKNCNSIGIIGESGCGKSTLLRQLSGIETPDNGTIIINGLSPIEDNSIFLNKIAIVFQKHNLFPHLTLKKNITLILSKIKKYDKSKANAKADELLKMLFIESEADKKPHEVSGGQAQRGSIARALATDPEFVFLDEPTAALDPILTDEVLKAVTQLKNDGRSFIFVTHEIPFLKNFADYIVFMKDGKIAEHGDISLLQNPKTQELRDFLKIH